MKRVLALALLCTFPLSQASADAIEQRAAESRAVVKAFAAELKQELKRALKEGGPVKAITVCNAVAPAIAKQQSTKHGWQIGRTSLRVRNPANAPDGWERAVLERFEARRKAGEDPAKMEYFEVVQQNGKKLFRYMKAIPTAEKPCLMCHGSRIKPEVTRVLDKLYPNDQARGFKAGDIRGAFTITQPM